MRLLIHFGVILFSNFKVIQNYIIVKFIKYMRHPKIEKVQVGKDQAKVQSEKDSHSKNRGGKKTN